MKLEHFKIRYESHTQKNKFFLHIKHKETNDLTFIKKEYIFSSEKELYFFYRLFKTLQACIKKTKNDNYYVWAKFEEDVNKFLKTSETYSLKLYKNASVLYSLEHEEHILTMLYPATGEYQDIEEIDVFYIDENNSKFVLAEK